LARFAAVICAALLVTSAVKSLAVASAWSALATAPLEALGSPAVPVNTSTFPAFAAAGEATNARNANSATVVRSALRQRLAINDTSILDPSSEPLGARPTGLSARSYQWFDVSVN
jgi:hypothetical protein